MKTKGKTVLAGLIAAGLMTAAGTGAALAQQEEAPEGFSGPTAQEAPAGLAGPGNEIEGGHAFPIPNDTRVAAEEGTPFRAGTPEQLAGPRSGGAPEGLAGPGNGAEEGQAFPRPDDPGALKEGTPFEAAFPVVVDVETVADVLGLTPEELHARMIEGESLSQIAGPGKTQELIDAIVAAQEERIESERAAGNLGGEEAAEAKEGLRERVTELVDGGGPERPEDGRPTNKGITV